MSDPTLTTQQLTDAANLLSDTSVASDQRVMNYYRALSLDGIQYAGLALSVAQNASLQGLVANAYLADFASSHGLLYNETIASDIRLELAQSDLSARIAAQGGSVSGITIDAYHSQTLEDNGYLPDAWVGHAVIEALGEPGWQMMLQGGPAGLAFVTSAMIVATTNPAGDFSGEVTAIGAQNWFKELGATLKGSAAAALAAPDSGIAGIIVTPHQDGSMSFSIGQDFDEPAASFDLAPSGVLARAISYTADQSVAADFDSSGKMRASEIVYSTGASVETQFNDNTSVNWRSRSSIYDAQDRLIGTSEVDRDGTTIFTSIDAGTGNVILKTIKEDDGSISQEVGAHADYRAFVGALADTLASQLIANFLTQNNIPATIAVQAFAKATIQTALAGPNQNVDFADRFANSAFNIAGGIAGSIAGADIAKALGLPVEAGQILGGIAGNELTQILVKEAASSLNLDFPVGGDLTINGLSNALAGSLGGLAGSELASLLMTPTIEGQITGALAATAAFAILEIDPLTAPFALVFSVAFGSNFVGNLFGDLIGTVFGGFPSVGPNASSVSKWNPVTHQFEYKRSYTDNGATADQVNAMGNALTGAMNSLMTAIGGQVTGPEQDLSLAWIDGKYYFTFGDHYPARGMAENPDPNAVVQQAAIAWLKALNIKNGNPLMTYVAEHTAATTLDQLAYDLTAARDYSLYLSNPVAFDLGIALSGDPAKLATWQAELARVGQLGLTHLTAAEMANLAQFGTEAPWRESKGVWTLTPDLVDGQGHPFVLPADTTVIAGGKGLLGAGEYDVITISTSTFDWKINEFDATGHLLGSAVVMQAGRSVGQRFVQNTGHQAQIIGTDQRLLGTQGADLIVYERTTGISIMELDPAHPGVVVQSMPLRILNGPQLFAYNDGMYLAGTAQGLLGGAGRDLVLGNPSAGDIWVAEMNPANPGYVSVLKELKLPSGTQFTVPASFDVVATLANYHGHGGNDILLRYADGTVHDIQLDASGNGTVLSDSKLTFSAGGDFILDSGASITLLKDSSQLFVRHADQHVSIVTLDADGHVASQVDAKALDGSLLKIPNGVNAIGAYQGILHSGAEGVLLQYPDGHLAAKEIAADGHVTAEATLTTAAHTPFVLDPGSTIALKDMDAFHKGESDFFIIKANGQFAIDGFDANGVMVAGGTLMNSGGAPFAIDPSQKVIGIDNDFAAGTTDLFIQGAAGSVSVAEFNSTTDRLIKTVTLTQSNGQPLYLAKNISIIGVEHNAEGRGEAGLVIRNADHSITTLGFDPNTGKQLVSAGNATSGTGPQELDFDGNVSHDSIWVQKNGADLVVSVLGSGDSFTFKNFDSTPSVTVRAADGLAIDHANLLLEAAADAAYEIAHPDFDHHSALTLPDDPTFKAVHAAHWHFDL